MAEKVPGWLERILLPQLSEIKGEIRAVNGRIGSLEGRMDGEFTAVHSEVRGLDEKIGVEINRLDERIGGLDKRLEFAERMSKIESRVATLEARKQGV